MRRQIETTRREMVELQASQKLLRDSIDNSKRTMDQLLELQRLSLEKSTPLPADSQTALDTSLQTFLQTQSEYQRLSQQINEKNRQITDFEAQLRENDAKIAKASEPANQEYQTQAARHRMQVAIAKLALLIPLLLIAAWLFYRNHAAVYAPVYSSMGLALAIRVMLVLHEYFPSEIFRYILVGVSIVIVLVILIKLLRNVAFPKRDWMLKQYREAYTSMLCPVCEFPIRRGPLKYLAWTARTIRKSVLHMPATQATPEEQPYTCPCCGTRLYDACKKCSHVTPSLLPHCEHCGVCEGGVFGDHGVVHTDASAIT